MTDAIGYIRFSTPAQEGGSSRNRQDQAIRAHCCRHGWSIVEMVEDLGRSAYKGDHLASGNLGKLTRRIHSGELAPGTVIVVELLDRLSRQGHRKALRWMEDVCDRGLIIAVVSGDRLYDAANLDRNIMDVMEIMMRAKLAHDESEQKGMRVGKAWKRKLEATRDGEVLTKGCPGWLEAVGNGEGDDGTSFRVRQERADVIREVYKRAARGDGLTPITGHLNATFKHWGRNGDGFSLTQVRRWLMTVSVEGDFIPYEAADKPNGERVVGYYPRIVPADLVARARAGLASRRGTGGPRVKNAYSNLFMGQFRCACCFGKMVIKRTTGPGYLVSQNHSLGRGCSNNKMFRYRDFEASAIKEILHLVLDDRFFVSAPAAHATNVRLAQAKKDATDLADQMERITDLMSKVVDPVHLIASYDGLAEKLAEARAAIDLAERDHLKARGHTSAEEHRNRILTVAGAIYSDDYPTRLEARQRVYEAVKSMVQMVVCDHSDMTLTLIMAGGGYNIQFGKRGEIVAHADMLDFAATDEQARNELIRTGGPDTYYNLIKRLEGPNR